MSGTTAGEGFKDPRIHWLRGIQNEPLLRAITHSVHVHGADTVIIPKAQVKRLA